MNKIFFCAIFFVCRLVLCQDVTPDTALEILINGNSIYQKNYAKEVFARPLATILTCSDSRIEPEKLFEVKQGDLFVIRNAGNILNDVALASIYYGVFVFNTPLLIVLGHEDCGAVNYSLRVILGKEKPNPNLNAIFTRISPAIEPLLKKYIRNEHVLLAKSILSNALYQNEKIQESLPSLKKLVKEKKLKILTGAYHVSDGSVHWFNQEKETASLLEIGKIPD